MITESFFSWSDCSSRTASGAAKMTLVNETDHTPLIKIQHCLTISNSCGSVLGYQCCFLCSNTREKSGFTKSTPCSRISFMVKVESSIDINKVCRSSSLLVSLCRPLFAYWSLKLPRLCHLETKS